MDKNGKIFGKISIIDVFAIILVLAVVIGIGVRYGAKATMAVQSSEQFECVVEVANVREFTVKALEKGGIITDKKSEIELGEIISVETKQADFQSTTADGRIITTMLPERYNCIVKIKASGKVSDDAYIMDDSNELSVGRTIELYSKYVKTSGEIKSVKMLEE